MSAIFHGIGRPATWRRVRVKDVTIYVGRGDAPTYTDEPTGFLALSQKCIRSAKTVDLSLCRPQEPHAEHSPALLRVDDILVNSTGTGTLGRAGLLAPGLLPAGESVLADGHVTVVRSDPTSVIPGYLWYLLSTDSFYFFANQCLAVGSTNQTELVGEAFRSMMIDLPRLAEQRRLVEFLNVEVAAIDGLIDEELRCVDLLDERVRNHARRATTGALAPCSEVVEQGTWWLPPTPRGWRVQKIAWRFKTGSGTTPKSDRAEFFDGPYPWVNTGELRDGTVVATAKTVTDVALQQHSSLRMYPAGSLVIAMYGATIGRLGVLGVDATVNQACCVLTEPAELDQDFTFYWLWAHRPEVMAMAEGGGQPNINQDVIRSLRIPAPSLEEQRQIVQSIESLRAEVDVLTAEIIAQLDLLREHRQALITAAVTGGLKAVEKEVA